MKGDPTTVRRKSLLFSLLGRFTKYKWKSDQFHGGFGKTNDVVGGVGVSNFLFNPRILGKIVKYMRNMDILEKEETFM